PQPNNVYADLDRQLHSQYGDSLEAALPDPGNPASYPVEKSSGGTVVPPTGANTCDGPPSGDGSGNTGIKDYNPFVAPTPPPAPNVLMASQSTVVNPASFGDEAGTVSTLTFDSTKGQSSSTEFTLGAEAFAKIFYAKFGASYDHGWGTETSTSFT